MQRGAISAGCVVALLLSNHGATQLAPLYTAVVALPFAGATSGGRYLLAALAVSATLAVTWHPFDLMSAAVAAIVSGATLVRQTAAAPKAK